MSWQISQILPNIAKSWRILLNCPKSGQSASSLIIFGEILSLLGTFRQTQSNIDESAEFCRMYPAHVEYCQIWPNIAKSCPILSRRFESGQIAPNLAKCQICPTLFRSGIIFPNRAESWQRWPNLAKCHKSPLSRQILSNPGNSGRFLPNIARSYQFLSIHLKSCHTWSNFVKFRQLLSNLSISYRPIKYFQILRNRLKFRQRSSRLVESCRFLPHLV